MTYSFRSELMAFYSKGHPHHHHYMPLTSSLSSSLYIYHYPNHHHYHQYHHHYHHCHHHYIYECCSHIPSRRQRRSTLDHGCMKKTCSGACDCNVLNITEAKIILIVINIIIIIDMILIICNSKCCELTLC